MIEPPDASATRRRSLRQDLTRLLRRLRGTRGLSGRATAAAMRMRQRTYANFESGVGPAHAERLIAFAQAVDVDPAALILCAGGLDPLLALACADNKAVSIAMAALEDLHREVPDAFSSLTAADLVGAFDVARRDLTEIAIARSRARLERTREAAGAISARQLECLRWAQAGKSSTDIGAILGISRRTVDGYLALTCARLGVRTRVQAISLAIELGLLSPRPP